jgi:EmrB/QacA subfamily drug resistance transporter
MSTDAQAAPAAVPAHSPGNRTVFWTFVVTSVAAFMVSLDNLVVTMALPVIRRELHASLADLEWTVNAYTLTFGVFLLTGATLGERYGRRRILTLGLVLFTLASAAAALSTTAGELVAARAVQGIGGALILPLTLTMLSAAVPAERRGAALGVWGAVSGLAVAAGPLIGGAVVDLGTWQWIFWINVPIGLIMIPLAATRLSPGRAERSHLPLDIIGVVLASLGLFGIVFGLVRANTDGWTSPHIIASFVGGAVMLGAFVLWETRAPSPMLPLHLFRGRGFSATNVASVFFSFGMFGSIFLLAQYMQTVQGLSPFEAGLKTLPWTAMPLLVAPIAGPLSDRIGGRPLLIAGLLLQGLGLGWLAAHLTVDTSYSTMVPAFIVSGIGMALFYVPVANVVLGSVPKSMEGVASGTNNALREIGGVFGVSVLASVFAARGGYTSAQDFVNGVSAAVWVGTAVVLVGAVVAVMIPRRRPGAVQVNQPEATTIDTTASGAVEVSSPA